MALANELDSPEGGPSLAYNLAYGRLLIYQNDFVAAIECLQSIVKVNCQVCKFKSYILCESTNDILRIVLQAYVINLCY